MTAESPPSPTTPPPTPAAPARGRLTLWDLVKGVGQVALILIGLGLLLFLWIVFQLRQSYPEPHAVSAGAAWATREVALSAAQRTITGRLIIEGPTMPVGARLGINAGVPSLPAPGSGSTSLAPADAIAGPFVRLSTTMVDAPGTCTAPCELPLPPGVACTSGTCRSVLEFTVALVGLDAAMDGIVTVRVAGGLTIGPDKQLPDGLTTQLVIDQPSQPGAS